MKHKKLIKRSAEVLLTAVFLGVITLNVYIMMCGFRGKAASVFGKSVLKVTTGSMEPSLHVDDYIIVEKTSPAKLTEGDIISFYSTAEDIRGNINTHRIIGKSPEGFITKGDANPVGDSATVPEGNIIGKYIGKSRFVKWLDSVTSLKKLVILAVMIAAMTFIVYSAAYIVRIKVESAKENAEEIKQQLIREAIEAEKKRLSEENSPAKEVSSDESGKNNEAEDVHCDRDKSDTCDSSGDIHSSLH